MLLLGPASAPRHLGETKIENLYSRVPGDEDVFRLQVAMNDPLLIGGRQSESDLPRNLDRLARRQCPGTQPFAERLSFEQLAHHVRSSIVGSDVVHGQNVWMIQGCYRAGFALEALQAVGVRRKRWRQHLDGNNPIKPRVASPINLAHSARPKRRLDLVRPQFRSSDQRHE